MEKMKTMKMFFPEKMHNKRRHFVLLCGGWKSPSLLSAIAGITYFSLQITNVTLGSRWRSPQSWAGVVVKGTVCVEHAHRFDTQHLQGFSFQHQQILQWSTPCCVDLAWVRPTTDFISTISTDVHTTNFIVELQGWWHVLSTSPLRKRRARRKERVVLFATVGRPAEGYWSWRRMLISVVTWSTEVIFGTWYAGVFSWYGTSDKNLPLPFSTEGKGRHSPRSWTVDVSNLLRCAVWFVHSRWNPL